ncbi:MAG: hypothetical protein VKK42_28820 [Lyngbya sp.]|nr:hypothetical protein [Lyngbya sp.]
MNTKSFLFGIILFGLGVAGFGFSLQNSYADNTPAEGFIARGTEPFWSVKVTRGEIVFSSPTTDEQKYPYSKPMTASGRPADLVQVYPLQGNPSGFLIIRQDNACSDGMSDNVYPYNATLIRGSEVLEGCAEKR